MCYISNDEIMSKCKIVVTNHLCCAPVCKDAVYRAQYKCLRTCSNARLPARALMTRCTPSVVKCYNVQSHTCLRASGYFLDCLRLRHKASWQARRSRSASACSACGVSQVPFCHAKERTCTGTYALLAGVSSGHAMTLAPTGRARGDTALAKVMCNSAIMQIEIIIQFACLSRTPKTVLHSRTSDKGRNEIGVQLTVARNMHFPSPSILCTRQCSEFDSLLPCCFSLPNRWLHALRARSVTGANRPPPDALALAKGAVVSTRL